MFKQLLLLSLLVQGSTVLTSEIDLLFNAYDNIFTIVLNKGIEENQTIAQFTQDNQEEFNYYIRFLKMDVKNKFFSQSNPHMPSFLNTSLKFKNELIDKANNNSDIIDFINKLYNYTDSFFENSFIRVKKELCYYGNLSEAFKKSTYVDDYLNITNEKVD